MNKKLEEFYVGGLVFSINARAKIPNATGEAKIVSRGPRWNSFCWLVLFIFGQIFGPVGAFHSGFVKCFFLIF